MLQLGLAWLRTFIARLELENSNSNSSLRVSMQCMYLCICFFLCPFTLKVYLSLLTRLFIRDLRVVMSKKLGDLAYSEFLIFTYVNSILKVMVQCSIYSIHFQLKYIQTLRFKYQLLPFCQGTYINF